MIDERTSRLNLALPVNSNTLKDDCERLRETISTLDAKVATIDADGKLTVAQLPTNVSTVGSDGKLPVSALPAIAITETFPVASQAAMLALTAQTGDVAVRTDLSKSFILMAEPATTLSNWVELLNDVLVRLANVNEGDALVAVKLNATGAVSRTQHDKNAEIVSVSDFGAKGDGVTDDAPAINAAISYLKSVGGGELRFKRGTYLCSALIDLKGVNICLRGEGQQATKLKANFTGTIFIDLYESVDSRLSPVMISDMTIDGNGTIGRVMSLRFRHYTKFTNVLFTGGTNAAVYAIDAWLNIYENCGFESSNFGLHLDGANHRTACYSCSFQGNTSRNLVVRPNGAANDGNTALYFANCDFEFAAGMGIDFQGSDMTLDCCYLGENLQNSCIQVYEGTVRINGGVIFFGYTAATYMAYMTGGTLIVDGATINGQSFGSLSTLAAGVAGKVAFRNCQLNFPMGGTPVMDGDVLLNLNDKKVFAPRLGVDYIGYGLNATVTDVVSGSNRTVTATAVPGPSPIIGLRASLSDMQWRDGEPWAVVVSYSSNVDFNVRVAAAAAGAGTFIGTLPATGGAVKTAVLYTKTAVRTTATVIEIYRDTSVAVGHTLTLRDISFGDSRAMGKEFGGNAGNIYKF